MKIIKLTNTIEKVALVDDEDFERVNTCHWRHDDGYAKTGHSSRGDMWRMSEFVMGIATGKFIWDHKDRNGLNNQKENLRLATRSQNGANREKLVNNTHGYKGIKRMEYKGKVTWNARITYNGQAINIGTYATKEQAALAYNRLALDLLGEFAVLNEIKT